MKRLGFILAALAMLTFGITTSAQAAIATTINPSAAPTGTHLQTGAIACAVNPTTQLVTCTQFELAGVGNANARATLNATYTATVQCRNHGGQIVEVHSQDVTVSASTGTIEAKNGRLTVPQLTSAPAPTAAQFEALATCPNPNWTAEVLASSISLASFTYTLTFVGFDDPAITIIGP
jgi:hypothetical protein